MSEVSEIVGRLNCRLCPFISCYEKGTCYQCHCYLNNKLNLEKYCDDETLHPQCLLMTGERIIISATQEGELIIGHDFG